MIRLKANFEGTVVRLSFREMVNINPISILSNTHLLVQVNFGPIYPISSIEFLSIQYLNPFSLDKMFLLIYRRQKAYH